MVIEPWVNSLLEQNREAFQMLCGWYHCKPMLGFHAALQDLDMKKSYVVYSGTERYIMQHGAEAISLIDVQNTVRSA